MKKFFSALLWAVLCLCLLPAAFAAEEEPPYVTRDPKSGQYGLSAFSDGQEIVLLPKEYNYIDYYSSSDYIIANKIVTEEDDWHYDYCLVDRKGNFILPLGKYEDIEIGDDGIALVRDREGRWAYFRAADATFITDFCFLEDYKFHQLGVNSKLVDGRELYGAVDRNGVTIIPFEYDYISEPQPSYYAPKVLYAKKDGKYGAFNYDGSVLRRFIYPGDTALALSLSLPAQMSEEEELSALIAASQTWEPYCYDEEGGNGLWGYKATQYDTEFPPSGSIFWADFASAQSFDETGHAKVTLADGQVGVIDQSGTFTPAPLNARFSDVLAESWYDLGVTTCAEKGVMVGTAEGIFSPNGYLTDPECLTLALRLYDLQRGGDGTLEKAPADYGYMTLSLADGKTFYRYGERNSFFGYGRFSLTPSGDEFYSVFVQAPGNTPEERETYAKAHEGAALFTAGGRAWPGTVSALTDPFSGPCLLFSFDCPEGERPDLDALFADPLPGADKWYRDAVYTARQWGLDSADGFSVLVNLTVSQPSPMWTSRSIFASALAVASGTLEKKYDVPRIPDTERQYNEDIYSLYEAGILSGTDEFGTFSAYKDLTRAECAVMVARVLDSAQRLTAPPATPNGYEQAVIDLRSGTGHHNERAFETESCTIFVYDRGGFMNAPTGVITAIFKPGSAVGDGVSIDLPYVRSTSNGMSLYPADTMALSEDGKTFTYSYFSPSTVWDSSLPGPDPRSEPGMYTFTLDTATGEVSKTYRPVDYAGALAHVTAEFGKNSGWHIRNRVAEQVLESPLGTVVLMAGDFNGKFKDYSLWLVSKPGSPLGDGVIKQLLLPSTACASGYSYAPTDRAPDPHSLTLSEDGKTLTYRYSFDAPLTSGDTVYHEAGKYLYTADLTTGAVTANVDILSQLNVSYWNILDSLKTEQGYMMDNFSIDYDSPATPLLRYKVCAGDPDKRDYELYLIYRAAQPQLYRLALPSTEVLPDGSAPTTREPDSLAFNDDYTTLTYTYRFPQPLKNGESLLHDKGTYIYTVDIPSARQSVKLVDSYEKALAEVTRRDGTWQIDQQLETPLCTILAQHSEGGGGLYPRAHITLIFKDGSPNGAGEMVELPTKRGGSAYSSVLPHSISLNEEKTVLTYVYQFDEDQYAATKTGMPFFTYEAGTYTTTVDLMSGTIEETFTPKE